MSHYAPLPLDPSPYSDAPHPIVLIPHWVESQLLRNGIELQDILNYGKIEKAVASYDLAAMIALTRLNLQAMGLENAVMGQDISCPLDKWARFWPIGSEENKKLYNTLLPLADSEEVIQDTAYRLFGEKRVDLDQDLTFKIVELQENHLGVVIYPGYFNGNPEAIRIFLDALMQTQYQHHPLHTIAQRPLFRRYLGLLPKKRVVA